MDTQELSDFRMLMDELIKRINKADPVTYTPEEAAEILKIKPTKMYELIKNNEIGFTRHRRTTRLTPTHIHDFLNRYEVPASVIHSIKSA